MNPKKGGQPEPVRSGGLAAESDTNMKNRNIVRFTAAALLTFLLASPLLAQGDRQVGQQRERVTREVNGRTVTVERPTMLANTEANFERYRSDLQVIMLAQKEIAKTMHLEDKINEVLDPLLLQLPTMKFSDFSQMKNGFVDLSLLREAVTKQQEVTARVYAKGTQAGQPTQSVIQSPQTDPFPDAVKSLNLCP